MEDQTVKKKTESEMEAEFVWGNCRDTHLDFLFSYG